MTEVWKSDFQPEKLIWHRNWSVGLALFMRTVCSYAASYGAKAAVARYLCKKTLSQVC